MDTLAGRIALVTGGSEGIGFAVARQFANAGAFVFITGRRQPQLDAAVTALGANAAAVRADSAKLEDLNRLYAEIGRQKGRLDVVFVNASSYARAALGEITEEQIDTLYAVNVKGVVFTVQKALPLMGSGGSIILNSSIGAVKGFAGLSVLSATQAAVRSFARGWTQDLKGRGIRVNVISPGPIATPGLKTATGGSQEVIDRFAAMVPLGRVGAPEEVAKAALFLASGDSSFMTATDLVVDGGMCSI